MTMATLRAVAAFPLQIVAGIAFLLAGLQVPLAILAVTAGAAFGDALWAMIVNSAVLSVVGTIVGGIAFLVRGWTRT